MSKSTFSDSHQYVQRYEDISTKEETVKTYGAKKVSKVGIVFGIGIVLAATLGIGILLSSHNASASDSHFDTSMEDVPNYSIGYDDGYGEKHVDKAYANDQVYMKGYADGQEDAK